MIIRKAEIAVPGQKTGKAVLTCYQLDQVSAAPMRKRPAVIVCPGGGYQWRSDREGEPVALQFMAMGCHAFVMDYSVAPNRFPTALLELAEAVALIREHAVEWTVDPEKIVVCGFSAGGHLACSLGVFWNQRFVYENIGKKAEAVRPNGLILCYPVITSGEFAHEGSLENLVGENASQEDKAAFSLEKWVGPHMPGTFLWHTYSDGTVPVENSLLLAMAMKAHGVGLELHIYPHGKHGLSLANEETGGSQKDRIEPECQSWIHLAGTWISNLEYSPGKP